MGAKSWREREECDRKSVKIEIMEEREREKNRQRTRGEESVV